MKMLSLLSFFVFTINATAQFYNFPLPPSAIDYQKFEKAGITVCKEYRIENGQKLLTGVLEFGAKGLPVSWMEKGVNDDGDSITISETTYSYKNGKLASVAINNTEEGITETSYYTYDLKGRLLKKETVSIDPPTYIYRYHANGQLKEVSLSIKMPAYDENGDPTDGSVDIPISKMAYKYDTKNRLIEEWYYTVDRDSGNLKPDYITQWQYDAQNNIVAILSTEEGGQTLPLRRMEYNKAGLLTRMVMTTVMGETEELIYEYCTTCKQSWMQ